MCRVVKNLQVAGNFTGVCERYAGHRNKSGECVLL